MRKPTSAKVGKYMRATFAAGCFWCIQPPFDKLKGVISTKVGYTGGEKPNPTYKQVAYGLTKHTESIEVIYNPKVVSYATLLKVFWTQIDPTVRNRQFVDVGTQYRAAVFYHNEEQRKLAEQTKALIAKSGCFSSPIVTSVEPARPFYNAETYHQQFYKKSTYRYKSYRMGSGRDRFIERYWSRCKVLTNWPK
ncbi:MAG: peptide-methionine (S)-S-oxide reductase [Deltaproteobacteria bacterium]|nr:MAG: peptide-methionine (S)-S-oxide reductase [Deltaproteobacteria bacterium]